MTPRAPAYSAPPETAVLTARQLAAWLQVSERQVERLDDVPYFEAGGSRSKRYLVRDVLRWMARRGGNGGGTLT